MFNILIFLFILLMIFNSLAIILSNNSIHSVLFLVLNFIISSGLLLVFEREFIALSFLIIYVGAISILFLFVVMMLDIKIKNSQLDLLKYFPIGFFLGILFFLEVIYMLFNSFWVNTYEHTILANYYINWFKTIDNITDIVALGQIIYTHYIVQFLLAGIILLVAVIAAVVMTQDNIIKKPKKQILFKQISRQYKSAIII
uniref:NADH-ubiquinone oxidoreductase chain 6 n=1 Tax=Coscinodiscus wailesii TaxID=671091 RepID=A0A7T8G4V4_9STRA|nr:NADH dehydrogenase subunit 6 [Coscinodiscus wailesii]QQP21858.1 NADH dehydrogenase subunit 6 [Coscinodiscus wailesii]